VHAQRVEVLHVADRDAIVADVADDLRSGGVACCRGLRAVSRCWCVSCPSDEAIGGLSFDFGQVRTESRHAAAALSRRPFDRCVAAAACGPDAIDATAWSAMARRGPNRPKFGPETSSDGDE
jgi:hypothetical protein